MFKGNYQYYKDQFNKLGKVKEKSDIIIKVKNLGKETFWMTLNADSMKAFIDFYEKR